jgi:hypothetical protein
MRSGSVLTVSKNGAPGSSAVGSASVSAGDKIIGFSAP